MAARDKISVFEYLYRDAGNFKSCGRLYLAGTATSAHEKKIRAHLESEEHFIAEQVSIPPLYEGVYEYSGGPNSDDHVWHEFDRLRPLEVGEVVDGEHWGTVKQLVARFEAVAEWRVDLSPHYCLDEWDHD